MFEDLKLPAQKKNKTGYSTDENILKKMALLHPAPKLILEHRAFFKILSTYIKPLLAHIHTDGKIHSTFSQAGTSTGRFSCHNPNLQNLPTAKTDELNIRRAFIVKNNDFIFLSADYSQIELRIIAHMSEDEFMIKTFEDDKDIHTQTAVKLFNLKDEKNITSEMRRLAKTINFGVLYGMSAHSLAEETGMFHNQAKKFIENYFANFPKIKIFFDKLIYSAKKSGYVETIFGRRRYIPELNASNKITQQAGIRMAMNMVVQGTAADILKLAILKINNFSKNYNAQLILTIHDELVFELPKNNVSEFTDKIKKTLETVVNLKVPLKTTIHLGNSLSEIKN